MGRKAGIHTEAQVTSHSVLFPHCESLRCYRVTWCKDKAAGKVRLQRFVEPHKHVTAVRP